MRESGNEKNWEREREGNPWLLNINFSARAESSFFFWCVYYYKFPWPFSNVSNDSAFLLFKQQGVTYNIIFI